MLYLALILLTLVLVKTIQSLSASVETGRHKALNLLRDECDAIYSRINNLKEQNFLLEKDVSQTITLYDITKDISRELDQEKILKIFKERANDYMKIDDCAILEKNENADLDEGFLRFPLVLNKEKKGCLIASGVEENDRERFKILAQQLLITIKRSLLYKKIQELAIMDGLTRVFCRRHFLERLNEEVKRSKKFKHSFSFLMVDIDKFKSFNDKYGHLVGDAILREVSKTIKET
ncbi:MAG: diguanylate cyclase, partial [Candidatus Omnitrophica bacterium]|nr:diguanylate cyclase [Candidatus Omnitrophota bacterium]